MLKNIYISKDDFICKFNQQSCDCIGAVIEYGDEFYLVRHEKYEDLGQIKFSKIDKNEYDKDYLLDLSEEHFVFDKAYLRLDKTVDAVKFKSNECFLFIFSDEYNLIITKSKSDLIEDDNFIVSEYTFLDIYKNNIK